jgi:SAM-dependent methyltransferase
LPFDLDVMAQTPNYSEWIYSVMRPHLGSRILEVGCGIGNFTPLLLRENRAVMAIDIEPRLIETLRAKLGSRSGLTVRQATIQSLVAELAGSFDSVVSSNVLEHIADGEEAEVIRATHALLKPGGASVHWVPAGPALFGSLDRAYGHFRRYNKARLVSVFEQAGFRVERCRYWNAIGVLGWWWQGRVLKVQRIPERSALLFDRFAAPVLRRIEPLLWLPAGQSLSIVARKPN